MDLAEITGVAGPNGCGKDRLAWLRAQIQKARSKGLSDILRTKADLLGVSHTRENLGAIGGMYAREFGPGALAFMTIQEYRNLKARQQTGLSIISIRRPAEATEIQQAGGQIVWIDAEREVRYQRILARDDNRVTDMVTFEEFVEQEEREMHPQSDDPSAMNMAAVRAMADVNVVNNFDTVEEYDAHLINMFHLVKPKRRLISFSDLWPTKRFAR